MCEPEAEGGQRYAPHTVPRIGPTGSRPRPWMFDEAPSQTAWQDSLDYQGQTRVSADQALRQVRDMWLAVSGES